MSTSPSDRVATLAVAPKIPGLPDYRAAKASIISRMRLVAKARFNAHERLTSKASATNFGLQMANLYTIAIAVLLLNFHDSPKIFGVSKELSYISLMSSVFVQIMALVESLKDYSGKARQMHLCAVQVNELHQSLDLEVKDSWDVLRRYNSEYNSIIRCHPDNHSDLDYRRYLLEETRKKLFPLVPSEEEVHWKSACRYFFRFTFFKLRYHLNVYGLTFAVLLIPWTAGVILINLGLT